MNNNQEPATNNQTIINKQSSDIQKPVMIDSKTISTNSNPLIKPKIIDPNLTIKNGDLGLHDTIAPKEVEVDFDHVKVNNVYYRTLFIAGYPRFVAPGWLEPVVNFNSSLLFLS